MNAPQKRRWVVITLVRLTPVLAGLFVIGFVFWNAMVREYTQEFVFPNGFKGGFEILENQPDGVDIERDGDRFIYPIPVSGVLKLRGGDPLANARTERVGRYRSGQPSILTYSAAAKGDLAVLIREGYVTVKDGRVLRGSRYVLGPKP